MFFTTRLIRFLRVGVGISNTDVEYADSTNSTVPPTTGWQTNAPKWQNGHFIWTRTHIVYTDGNDKYTDPVCLPSGKGIAKIVEQYYSSTRGYSLTGGAWSETTPSWVNGRYIWTRSIIYYTDGTSQTTNPVCTTGSKGEQGDQGVPGKDGADGTSIALRGQASGHYANCEQLQAVLDASPASLIEGDPPVLLDTSSDAEKLKLAHEGNGDYPTLITIVVTESGEHRYSLAKADNGACYVYNGNIYANTGELWYNLGQIQGPKGDPGDNGINATQYYYHVAWCNTPDNSDRSFVTECSDGDAYAYMGTCINTTKADPETFSSYNWVKVKGDPGEAGKDAITITMSLTAICHKKSSTDSKYATEVKMFEGDKQVPFTFSYASNNDDVTITNTKKGDSRIFYLVIKAGAVVNSQVTLSFGYKDKTYQRVISITTAVDGNPGAKGEVGATLRGPQSWSDLGDGYTFEAGDAGDEWKDVVIYGDIYFSCVKDHVKTADNYPGSPEDNNNGYWRAGKPMEIIATKILLAKFLQVDNLGAGAVVMKKDGKVVFKAEGGDVVCEKGTFRNVDVSGAINATSGSIGGFTIQKSQLHSAADGYSFDIYKDQLVYTDLRNYRTLSITSDESDGLKLTMSAADNNATCDLTADKRGMGVRSSNGEGDKSGYTENSMCASKGNCSIQFYISESFGNRMFLPEAGIYCQVDTHKKKMNICAVGLPTDASKLASGEIYVENGFLKLKS